MRKSALLRRMIILLLSAVLLSGVLSFGIYAFVTQRVYVTMQGKELLPIARTVSRMVAETQQNNPYASGIWMMLGRDNREFGATLYIYNAEGESVIGMQPPEEKEAEADRSGVMLEALIKPVLSGSEISKSEKTKGGESYLVVGVPIKNGDDVTGAVFLTKPMSELSDSVRGLNLTLIISTAIAFLVMLLPVYFATRRMVVPIRRMKDVAQAMSKGDFTVRADEAQAGEIGELAHSMNHFAEESGKLEQTRRDYVANVSHELRTPIASIRAMGETLRDGMAKTDEKKDLFYNNIVRESIRLSRLVDDLLELSRLQAGTESIQKTRFDLREVLRNVTDLYGHIAADAKLDFSLAANMDASIPAFGNPDRIEQVLVALLDNAIKYTPEGGAVTLSCANAGAKTNVSVTNTGGGISADDLSHIFERFYKADKSHSGEGTGLGLSIAKEIMSALGENITAASADGKTVFTISVSMTT
ncbi:MAG: HAMP domain-containing protein [Clostridiales Family XIII bacterium]|jgi:signal transduction histidine kinase|nr:HAMP domain-containing protein [Clostridiales Family XIII bacterium]